MTINFPRLRAHAFPVTELLRNVYVKPAAPLAKFGHVNWGGGGIYLPNGRPHSWLKPHMFHASFMGPAERSSIKYLAGPVLFAGVLKPHFGHFYAESIGRLWALEKLGDEIPLLYLYRGSDKVMNARANNDFFRALEIRNPIVLVHEPMQLGQLWNAMDLMRPLLGEGIYPRLRSWILSRAPDGASLFGHDLYVSRSGLKDAAGHLLGEEFIENGMQSEGYQIFRPEEHSLSEQIAAYRGARRIVLSESGSLHMMSIFADPRAKVAIIRRRPQMPSAIRSVRKAFATQDIIFIDAIKGFWTPVDNGARESFRGVAEIDFAAMWHRLARSKFIARAIDKPVPSQLDMSNLQAKFTTGEITRYSDR